MYILLEQSCGGDAFEHMLEAAREGDEVAFAQLWRWLNPLVLRWLRVVSPGTADDVCSEVWLTIARKLDSFQGGEAEFRGWVFLTARRRVIDNARRRARQPATIGLDGIDSSEQSDASVQVLEDEATAEALALLGELPAQQAEVLALRIIAGLTVAQAAAVVGKSEVAVRVLCHRGLRTLARRVSRDEVLEGVTR
jgi:RNA polymerase sigma-70 factor (ECF subfamily)